MTTIKITGNPSAAAMLYDLILRVANGEAAKAEKLGDYSRTTPHGTSCNGDY